MEGDEWDEIIVIQAGPGWIDSHPHRVSVCVCMGEVGI